jgi:PAS domain S-box-containing protein
MKQQGLTEQMELVHALRESEARYRNLLHSLPLGVYTCDKSGKINFYNDTAAHLWGHRPNLNDAAVKYGAGTKVFTLDEVYLASNKTPIAVALETGQSFRNFQLIVERQDGSRFYAMANINPLFDTDGNINGAINIFQDITEWKKVELELQNSELRYRQLIETLPAAMYTTDAEGRITLYNKAAVALWGREPEIGKDLWCGSWKILKPDGSPLPLDECPMAVALKERRPVFDEEIIVLTPDGGRHHVKPYPQPIFDTHGRLIGAVNMLVDITNTKRIESTILEREKQLRILTSSLERKIEESTRELLDKNKELKKSEERYHKMVEEVEDYAILLLSKEGIIENWNVGAEKIKGYKEKEIIGKHFKTFYLPEDREGGLPERLLNEAMTKGKALHEGWRMRKDGSRFWGSTVITALHNDRNEIIGFSKLTRDLSERKLSEDKIQQYAAELEFQNKELEEFAYAASHDLKEPLRKIHFYNTFLADNYAAVLGEKGKDYLNRSIAAVRRMRQLIEDILAYTKNTANIAVFEDVDLSAVAEDIALQHKDEMGTSNVNIVIDKLPVIRGIPFQLRQLFDNLINNSVKYRHPDRDCLIQVSSRKIDASQVPFNNTERSRLYHVVSVKDNGTGFDQSYAERIFEIFQRLHGKTETSGSGIGLAICKKIMQNHKGFIRALGQANQGACFELYFPV